MQCTAELLFQYLKDMLYDPEEASLSLEELPEEFRKLGRGMQFMGQCVKEARSFGMAMAKGDLSQIPPRGDNVLAAPMKELQSSLRHLTWQTQQVAKGDYGQTVDFMGDFAESFNTMTQQLKERQENLVAEKKKVEEKNQELERNLELVMKLTNYTHNIILVYSLDKHELLFSNDAAQWLLKTRPETAAVIQQKVCRKERETLKENALWELEVDNKNESGGKQYFDVESYKILWKHEMAVVHMMTDETERRKKENLMFKLAYVDPLTGLNNRRYAMNLMEQWMENKQPFTMSFVDVDYLKYCNDTLGHKCGDEYLSEVASALKSLGGEVCRIGGDEFMLLQTGAAAGEQNLRLEEVRRLLKDRGEKDSYPRSFSYATCEVPSPPQMELEEYIKDADARMYEYKVRHKTPLRDLIYRDDRVCREEP